MEDFRGYILIGDDFAESVPAFLTARRCAHTAGHVRAVAQEAVRLATHFHGIDAQQAAAAGWLHDISAVVPVTSRIAFAERCGIPVLPEERQAPMILHQKLSAVFAQHLFGVGDAAVLDAITCHTTLRRDAKPLDKVVFLADKIAWDQDGTPPYMGALLHALSLSLDAAVCVYLQTLWDRRQTLPVVHPWFVAAYEQLCGQHADLPAPPVHQQ
jgi:predicted HD superfamily hydrolase involved in NAD metabolism